MVPQIYEMLYSPNGLAGVLRLRLPNGPRRTIASVFSKIKRHNKQELDLFSMAGTHRALAEHSSPFSPRGLVGRGSALGGDCGPAALEGSNVGAPGCPSRVCSPP